MAYDKFMIAPLLSGLQTNVEPWQIPDDAFEQLDNAYIFRGKVRKRFGSSLSGTGWGTTTEEQLFSRLRVSLTGGAGVGITDGAGAATGTVPGAIFKIGQMFSIGSEMFTVTALGTPGTMLTTGSATTMTYNTTSGAYAFDGAPATEQVYFYPAEPVMGLTNYGAGYLTDQSSYAFDTQFVYLFSGGSWNRTGTSVFKGTNNDYFFSTTWTGATPDLNSLFVSNFNATETGVQAATDDYMQSFDGTTWADFKPKFLVAGAGHLVRSARIIVPFKDRLVLLNTIESITDDSQNSSYVNRCRYSQNGSPFATGAWYEKGEVGFLGGGYIDCPSREIITGAGFIKDRLIVYFERSTWELAYTGNQVLPFVWQKINTELGSEAPFSVVSFDKILLTLGDTGVNACNGGNVERIDFNIPDDIFKIKNEGNAFNRVAGIRDFKTEMVYWTFMTDTDGSEKTFPDRILVYNYNTGSWAFNDDCLTCFGFFEQSDDDTWQSTSFLWEESDFFWNSGVIQASFRKIIAGNHHGYILGINPYVTRNAAAMTVTNATNVATGVNLVVIDHTLDVGEYVQVENSNGATFLGNGIYVVKSVVDSDNVIISTTISGTYSGGATLARVSDIVIKSKQWNPYVSTGANVFLAQIDFCVTKTTGGQVTIDYSSDSSNVSLLEDGLDSQAIVGTNVLETSPYTTVPYENTLDRLWHSVYLQGDGSCIQIRIFLSEDQITTPSIANSNFEMQGLILYTAKTGY